MKFRDLCVGHDCVLCKKAEPIEMPFGADSRGPKEPCIAWGAGVHIGATWRIRWIDLCGGGDAACSLPLLYFITAVNAVSCLAVNYRRMQLFVGADG